ncbi:end processing RNAse Ngl2p [Scheffersomyces amazonensis]|uniref:end processing RNAse Ngl2p n=1 Tax=Scheffersomyces amazonensis TaxID=1078765 RepID=UPI00315CEBD2
MDPAALTPAYIEEQRRLRNLRKANKKKVQPPQVVKSKFIKRPFLEIPNINSNPDGFFIKVMSYNVLAQTLIRRSLFPTNGDALKWSWRSKALLEEFKHYDADILCLQEVDYIQYNSFWLKEFSNLGYTTKFYRSKSKNHGVAIVYRSSIFECRHLCFINYDTDIVSETLPSATAITQNIGLLVYLQFTSTILKKYPHLSKRNGVVIGSTHLYWKPFGSFERTRQTYILLHRYKEFLLSLNAVLENSKGFYTFMCGDFNSQPFDSPYLSIVAKPINYHGRHTTVLACSLDHFQKAESLKEEEAEEKEEEEEDEGGEERDEESKDPSPDTFDATEDQLRSIQQLQDTHNSLNMRAISLYSVGYKLVHPENSGLDNDRGEPIFSNWANHWQGLLDYIFVISNWEINKDKNYFNNIDSVEDLVEHQEIKLTRLLRLPLPVEMGKEPNGQPRLNQYPSDHLCLMAEIELV